MAWQSIMSLTITLLVKLLLNEKLCWSIVCCWWIYQSTFCIRGECSTVMQICFNFFLLFKHHAYMRLTSCSSKKFAQVFSLPPFRSCLSSVRVCDFTVAENGASNSLQVNTHQVNGCTMNLSMDPSLGPVLITIVVVNPASLTKQS